jgi:small subunit ribosomal protein S5
MEEQKPTTKKTFSNSTRRGGGQRGPGGRRDGGRGERVAPEFDQQILTIRRVVRVVRGGRRFSFSIVLAAGDRKGRIGLGVGKAADVSSGVEKALRQARKNMLKLRLTKNSSLPHGLNTKYGSVRLLLQPAPRRGVVAGSVARSILKLAGVQDVGIKILSKSKNKLNNARATMQALSAFSQ